MTDTTGPALRTALAYYQAWTSHDLDKAMSYIAAISSVTRRPGAWKAPKPTEASWARSCRSSPARR
jgi:hypothetical protein